MSEDEECPYEQKLLKITIIFYSTTICQINNDNNQGNLVSCMRTWDNDF